MKFPASFIFCVLTVMPSMAFAQGAQTAPPTTKPETECRKQSYERYAEGTVNRASRAAYIAQCMRGEDPGALQSRTSTSSGVTLGDIKAMGALQLSGDELKQLLSGAEVRFDGMRYRSCEKFSYLLTSAHGI